MTPEMSRLRGLPVDRAELYGKPHAGIDDETPLCAVCGRLATNRHHAAHRKWGRTFELATERGMWRLESALIALCGTGTTGCHGAMHGGARLSVRWVWDTEEAARAWWSGELLARYAPHDPALYGFGGWEFADAAGRTVAGWRGERR